jgi:hypothetical protein
MLKIVKWFLVVAAVVGGIAVSKQFAVVNHGNGNVVEYALRDSDLSGSQR